MISVDLSTLASDLLRRVDSSNKSGGETTFVCPLGNGPVHIESGGVSCECGHADDDVEQALRFLSHL